MSKITKQNKTKNGQERAMKVTWNVTCLEMDSVSGSLWICNTWTPMSCAIINEGGLVTKQHSLVIFIVQFCRV